MRPFLETLDPIMDLFLQVDEADTYLTDVSGNCLFPGDDGVFPVSEGTSTTFEVHGSRGNYMHHLGINIVSNPTLPPYKVTPFFVTPPPFEGSATPFKRG